MNFKNKNNSESLRNSVQLKEEWNLKKTKIWFWFKNVKKWFKKIVSSKAIFNLQNEFEEKKQNRKWLRLRIISKKFKNILDVRPTLQSFKNLKLEFHQRSFVFDTPANTSTLLSLNRTCDKSFTKISFTFLASHSCIRNWHMRILKQNESHQKQKSEFKSCTNILKFTLSHLGQINKTNQQHSKITNFLKC